MPTCLWETPCPFNEWCNLYLSRRGSYKRGWRGMISLSRQKHHGSPTAKRPAVLVSCSGQLLIQLRARGKFTTRPHHRVVLHQKMWWHIPTTRGRRIRPPVHNACWLNTPGVCVYKWTNLVVCALPRSSSLHTCLATASGPQDKLPFSGERFAPYPPITSVNGNNAKSKFDVYIQWPQVGVLSKWQLSISGILYTTAKNDLHIICVS